VAAVLLRHEGLKGLQGPTIGRVFDLSGDGQAAQHGFYAATICVPKKKLYASVKALQKVCGRSPCA
jgi:ATP phosphoribosyltransferase